MGAPQKIGSTKCDRCYLRKRETVVNWFWKLSYYRRKQTSDCKFLHLTCSYIKIISSTNFYESHPLQQSHKPLSHKILQASLWMPSASQFSTLLSSQQTSAPQAFLKSPNQRTLLQGHLLILIILSDLRSDNVQSIFPFSSASFWLYDLGQAIHPL